MFLWFWITQTIVLVILVMLILNPLTTNVPNHKETSQSICIANRFTGFYMMANIGLMG